MQKFMKYMTVLLSALIIMSGCKSDKDVIAKVGDLKIRQYEFEKQLRKKYPKDTDLSMLSMEKKQDVLDNMILTKLKVQAALDVNLDEDPDIQNFLTARREQLLGNKFYERVIVDKLVSEEDIHDYLSKKGIEMKASHILIGYKKANVSSDRTREEARKLASQIMDQVKNGADFAEMAMKYSDDPSKNSNRGDLGYFKWGEMVMPFQEACWEMQPGEFTGPVESRHGYHVIRLDDKREIEGYTPRMDDETVYRAKQALFSALADSGRKMWEKTFEELKEKRDYNLHEDNINNTSALITAKIKEGNLNADSFSDDEKSTVLLSWDGGKIVLEDLITKYNRSLARAFGMFREPNSLKRDIENSAMIKLVVTEAVRMNLDEEKDVSRMLQEFKENRLANLVVQREVREKIELTDEEIKKYYEENPDQFKRPAQIEIWEIQVGTENEAKRIKRMANKDNFGKLAKQHSNDKFFAKKGGYIGFRAENARGIVSKTAFEKGPGGKIYGPLKYRRNWVIAKTGKLKEESIRSYKEAKPSAKGKLRSIKIRETTADWENALHDKYKVKIYEDRLQNV